jgi:spore germination protein YaaH
MQQASADLARSAPAKGQASRSTPQSPATAMTSPNLVREVFGFGYLNASLEDPNLGFRSWNLSLLSTVAVFGLTVQGDGTFVKGTDTAWTTWNSSAMDDLKQATTATGTKVVLTIVLQDFCVNDASRGCGAGNPTPTMCNGLKNRATTVSQTVAEVAAKGVAGVNIDYEGLQVSCLNGENPQADLTDLARQLRAALPAGSYLSIDTYSSSASDPSGFFNIPALNPYADSFFVMAYDSDYSNYGKAPLNCSSYCLNPVSPLSGYLYNDTRAAAEYSSVAGASKVILGLPWYGRWACVPATGPHQYPTGQQTHSISYLGASGMSSDPTNSSYVLNRDGTDGVTPWSTWTSSRNPACTIEMYWDDATSLAQKYDLVNGDNLRGVGIWNLTQGGSASELWNGIGAKFSTTSPWYPLGGAPTSSAGASSWGPTRADVFVRGQDNAIWHAWANSGQWTTWYSIGGNMTSAPTAVSWGSNRIDIFARGTDNGLWHKWWDGTKWNDWEDLGGTLASAPTVSSWGYGRLDIFALGSANQMLHKSFNGYSWSEWQDLGGVFTADPSAVSWAANRVDVFGRGLNNAVWHLWWDGYRWNGWESLGGVFTTGPAAASCTAGRADVFGLGQDQSVYQLVYGAGGSPAWRRLGGLWSLDPGSVCRAGSSVVDLFEKGSDGALWRTLVPAA